MSRNLLTSVCGHSSHHVGDGDSLGCTPDARRPRLVETSNRAGGEVYLQNGQGQQPDAATFVAAAAVVANSAVINAANPNNLAFMSCSFR